MRRMSSQSPAPPPPQLVLPMPGPSSGLKRHSSETATSSPLKTGPAPSQHTSKPPNFTEINVDLFTQTYDVKISNYRQVIKEEVT